MIKLLTIEILFVILFLFFKNGESLKCFICKSNTDPDCDGTVNLKYSKECTPKNGAEVYCRKISQTLKFKNEGKSIYIRECAYEKGSSPCYRFKWLTLAKQQTCECKEENCNSGRSNVPNIMTTVLASSLLWLFNFLKEDHT